MAQFSMEITLLPGSLLGGNQHRTGDVSNRKLHRIGTIEQGIGILKRFKRVALRCEKTARNFRSIVSFAAGLCLIKFVHPA
jgi:hypothetical protein